MKRVELYGRVRHAVIVQGMSRREAARDFGIDRRTVDKMLAFSVPPGYRRSKPPRRPKLDPFTGIIDQILEGDAKVPKKQRHTCKKFSLANSATRTTNATIQVSKISTTVSVHPRCHLQQLQRPTSFDFPKDTTPISRRCHRCMAGRDSRSVGVPDTKFTRLLFDNVTIPF